MMSFKVRAMMGAGTVAAASAAILTIASPPLVCGVVFATVLFAALGYVAFAAHSRRFDVESRLVYQPVYVRGRTVQRRVRSFDD